MKFILRALAEEVIGLICLAAFLGGLAGLGWLLYWAFGDGAVAVAVGLLLTLAILQAIIVLRRAAELKRQQRPRQ